VNLAMMLETGEGGPKDTTAALQYFTLAAKLGNRAAMKDAQRLRKEMAKEASAAAAAAQEQHLKGKG
jgi:TPR repeat protein